MDPVEERIPCADEMCIGILDARGVCGTCGRVGEVSSIERAADEDAAGVDAAEASELTAPADEPVEASAPVSDVVSEEAVDPEERVPCVDEMCTGIIGADGRCGTCGKASD